MTRSETIAFNNGVAAVLDLAKRSADHIEAKATRPLHEGFATEALRALADEGCKILRPLPGPSPEQAR